MGGTLIETTTGASLERRDLRTALDSLVLSPSSTGTQSQATMDEKRRGNNSTQSCYLDVYIGVPRLKLGTRNVDPPEHRKRISFRTQWLDLPDELDAHASSQLNFVN